MQYDTQDAKNDLHHALDDDPVRKDLLKRGILVSNAKPPDGVETITDENMRKMDRIDFTGLPKGDHGWIFVERGREPVVVTLPYLRQNTDWLSVMGHDRAIYLTPPETYFGDDVALWGGALIWLSPPHFLGLDRLFDVPVLGLPRSGSSSLQPA